MTRAVVDAHVHVWDLRHFQLPWFRPGLRLPATASLDDLAAVSTGPLPGPGSSLAGVIAVQAADSMAEAAWLRQLEHPLLAGVVLQHVPEAPDATRNRTDSMVRGVRVAVSDRRADLSDAPGIDRVCESMAATGGVVEFLVRPDQLPAVRRVAVRHPQTTIVLCHLGLGGGEPDADWERNVRAIARSPHVAAKVSGVVSTADHDEHRLVRAVGVALDAFGPYRLAFGSDWPMSARVAPYRDVIARTAGALPTLRSAEATALWGGTASRLYHLDSVRPAAASAQVPEPTGA
jgi:L-fuconolactonase